LTNVTSTFASENNSFTLFINQVRGEECCDKGNFDNFQQQLTYFRDKNVSAQFALRWDVLTNPQYQAVIKLGNTHYGALLEITPEFAKNAGVEYVGSENNWYEARYAFLVGYSQEERKKLIDTYFNKFKEAMGYYPNFSTAWMIDPWSLRYLREEYGVLLHQITREQFGTDSYTLYGGPMHYPFYPSENWALIPSTTTRGLLPLIVRQTITDPVYNYGDRSSSYTSQPNDYMLRKAEISYFSYIFDQAHSQDNTYTFALLGLENSMLEIHNQEFFKQIDYVANWQHSKFGRVVTVDELVSFYDSQDINVLNLYSGTSQIDVHESAWWFQTPSYRVRLRLSNGELFISDLRVYDSRFNDPYMDKKAEASGWWIVPYIIDGSRHFSDTTDLTVNNDTLLNRQSDIGSPHRLTLIKGVATVKIERDITSGVTKVLANNVNVLELRNKSLIFPHSYQETLPFKSSILGNLAFKDSDGEIAWGLKSQGSGQEFLVFNNETTLDNVRLNLKPLLFPEASFGMADDQNTTVYVNNRYAVAGRNPVRVVLFPKDAKGDAIQLLRLPAVTTNSNSVQIAIHEPHSSNGMVFIDFVNGKPAKTTVNIDSDSFSQSETVFFAPNCKQKIFECLFSPKYMYWYVRSFLEDKLRQWRAKD